MTVPAVITEVAEIRQLIGSARASGETVGLVPTMGALHTGHLSLVAASRDRCDRTVVSIFVNPAQFGADEDLATYPHDLAKDIEALAAIDVDWVFAPLVETIYPDGFSTYVDPPTIAETLEGRCRPGHFRGVATVVLKLFQILPADVAFFGQKDFQQSRVIMAMVRDLDIPVEIVVCPIVREQDGLALSSRNQYLHGEQRQRATAIWQALQAGIDCIAKGERNADEVQQRMRSELSSVDEIDYVAVVCAQTLEPVDEISNSVALLLAARIGTTRLIDNSLIENPDELSL